MSPDTTNPGARAGATGADIIAFDCTRSSQSNDDRRAKQADDFHRGYAAGRTSMLDELRKGTDAESHFKKLGRQGVARFCLKCEFPYNDKELRFLTELTGWNSPTLKQLKWLRKLHRWALEEHVEVTQ